MTGTKTKINKIKNIKYRNKDKRDRYKDRDKDRDNHFTYPQYFNHTRENVLEKSKDKDKDRNKDRDKDRARVRDRDKSPTCTQESAAIISSTP